MADWPPSPELNRPPENHTVLSNDIASKALDAYKSNPLLTALFLLNLILFLGFGWFIWDKENKVAKFVVMLNDDLKEARQETIRIALQCQHQTQYVLPPQSVPAPPRRPK